MVRRKLLLLLSLSVAFVVPAAAGADKPPPHVERAMKELWRRGTCLLSSVHLPAERESAVPGDLGRTPLLHPRIFERQGAVLCYATDGGMLWAADDQALYQVDAAAGKLLKTYDRSAGLPDRTVQSIVAAGEAVWIATRGGLARLDVPAGKITPVEGVAFEMGRLAAGGGGVWLVSDAGAWGLSAGQKQWRKLPDFPGGRQLAETVRRGFWWAWWHRQMRVLLPSVFANADGLYVVCANRLGRYDPAAGEWQEIGRDVWEAAPAGRTVWALTTTGALRYDGATGKAQRLEGRDGLAAGRPVAMAATPNAFFVATQPDYDERAGRFVGGGVSRLDLATGQWTVTDAADGADTRFATALEADGEEAWAACLLYDKVHQRGAHPGMAHVKRWRPHASGIGLLHYAAGQWTLLKRQGLKTDRRWVMGQKGTVESDLMGPESVEMLRRCGDRVWGVYRIVPERYYAGYFISAGCLAARASDAWQGRFDCRTDELGFAGEQPELMLISHSHGERIVLAEGHPIALGIEELAGRTWLISEGGLFIYDAGKDKFSPVVRQETRLYWRATAAAAGRDAVWFGGDGGTISRLDRKTGRLELVGVVPGRRVARLAARDGKVLAVTERFDGVLPVWLASAPKLPNAEILQYDGKEWSAGSGSVERQALAWKFQRQGRSQSNYLSCGERRVAFVKGLFRPIVLCEDGVEGKLYLGAYSGVASIPLPAGAE